MSEREEAVAELIKKLTMATLSAVLVVKRCEKSGDEETSRKVLDEFQDLCADVPQPILAGCMLSMAVTLIDIPTYPGMGVRYDDAV